MNRQIKLLNLDIAAITTKNSKLFLNFCENISGGSMRRPMHMPKLNLKHCYTKKTLFSGTWRTFGFILRKKTYHEIWWNYLLLQNEEVLKKKILTWITQSYVLKTWNWTILPARAQFAYKVLLCMRFSVKVKSALHWDERINLNWGKKKTTREQIKFTIIWAEKKPSFTTM